MARPSAIERAGDGFIIRFGDGRDLNARCLVACAGEGNEQILQAAGHSAERIDVLRIYVKRALIETLSRFEIAAGNKLKSAR